MPSELLGKETMHNVIKNVQILGFEYKFKIPKYHKNY